MSKRFLSAKEAAAELSITLPTLYAYVSGGFIRSEEGVGKRRERRYRAADVRKLKLRKASRQRPEAIVQQTAKQALNFGAPVLSSALTLIEDGRLYYRGINVIQLSQSRTFEEVAHHLWHAEPELTAAQHSEINATGLAALKDTLQIARVHRFPLVNQLQVCLMAAGSHDLAAFDTSSTGVQASGWRILHTMLYCLVDRLSDGQKRGRIAHNLASAWLPTASQGDLGQAAELIDAALILCADHELNASSFAARVAASTGSNPYAAVAAGLSALQGHRHGGQSARVAAFLAEIDGASIYEVMADRLRRGERLPGFGHVLYPQGDPRCSELVQRLWQRFPNHPALDHLHAVIETAAKTIDKRPNIDFALVALARILKLPAQAPFAMFAVGRTAGWIAHALEQYETQQLIRPRALYIGERF